MRKLFAAAIILAGLLSSALAFNLPFAPAQVTASAGGVATVNQDAGIITTQALVTAGQASATFTINCNQVNQTFPGSVVMASVGNGTNTGGVPSVASVTTGNGVITVVIFNEALAANVFNGTLKIAFIVFN